jgi:hypothetical protein
MMQEVYIHPFLITQKGDIRELQERFSTFDHLGGLIIKLANNEPGLGKDVGLRIPINPEKTAKSLRGWADPTKDVPLARVQFEPSSTLAPPPEVASTGASLAAVVSKAVKAILAPASSSPPATTVQAAPSSPFMVLANNDTCEVLPQDTYNPFL